MLVYLSNLKILLPQNQGNKAIINIYNKNIIY